MAKINIPLVENFMFSTYLNVRITDINYGGHLGNDALLGLLHEARLRFLNKYNHSTELDCCGAGLIMLNIQVDYKAEGLYADKFEIFVTIIDVGKTKFDIVYKVVNVATNNVVAEAVSTMAFFDYKRRRIMRCPKNFEENFQLN
ncbi:thioesterase family protein [Lentisphaerota bacterium WC36G]|nr:thioesterase family protein [Lentisphaerae bacterium WC36]